MNNGPRPPVPGLIPISALCKSSLLVKNCWERRRSPCANVGKEVMGEQRSRRTGTQSPVDLIDTVRSRGSSAAPQAPFRKTKSQRHRKSGKRREHKSLRKRSASKQKWRSRGTSSSERTINPRVNPIFVWVRQEDTRIVDVKCEDYDKRNRILLTKTAHGWRAIPRTETWAPSLKTSADDMKRARKARKSNKVKRKSTAVQVEDDIDDTESHQTNISDSPTWTSPGDVESHLPSHTIHVNRHCSSSPEHHQIPETSNEDLFHENISTNKINETSPLDNLLAVAEYEFNQKIQSGEWNDTSTLDTVSSPVESMQNETCEDKCTDNQSHESDPIDFLLKCDLEEKKQKDKFYCDDRRSEDGDYDEEEENNLAMNDILNRLEQSLRTPEPRSPEESHNDKTTNEEKEKDKVNEEEATAIFETYEQHSPVDKNFEEPTDLSIGSSTPFENHEEEPKDLRTSKIVSDHSDYEKETATDLSITTDKRCVCTSSPRPYSRNSETVQSPQPSGLPPVPPSPDVFTTFGTSKNNHKPVFLETLLSPSQKDVIPDEKAEPQTEPLDLGKCRKSASPTVTCSEEVKKRNLSEAQESEPKKVKVEAITLKNILSADTQKSKEKDSPKDETNSNLSIEQSKLLELLTTDSDLDPLTQLKQLQSDTSVNLPDPLLIPKENLSQILMSPKKEIPRLLSQRPELRLPDALTYPHLLQDPNILVITLAQLQTIIQKQTQVFPPTEDKTSKKGEQVNNVRNSDKKPGARQIDKPKSTKYQQPSEDSSKFRCTSPTKSYLRQERLPDVRSDIHGHENFNQMLWLPYLQQLEAAALAFGGSPDLLKSFTFPFLPLPGNQIPGMSPMMGTNRFPPHPPAPVPFQQPLDYNSLFEYPNWQEALHQASYLRSKTHFDSFNFKGQPDRSSMLKRTHSQSQKPYTQSRGHGGLSSSKTNSFNAYNSTASKETSAHSTTRQSIQVPQYHPSLPPKNQLRRGPSSFLMQPEVDSTVSSKQALRSCYDPLQRSSHSTSATGMYYKNRLIDTTSNDKLLSPDKSSYQKTSMVREETKKLTSEMMQPIDLSTSQVSGNKTRSKLLDDSSLQLRNPSKQDDVPEVGSTTNSFEEVGGHGHDSQKYLWHPLFGSQKTSNSPANWTTLTATGE